MKNKSPDSVSIFHISTLIPQPDFSSFFSFVEKIEMHFHVPE